MAFGKENIRDVIAEVAKEFLYTKNHSKITMVMIANKLKITAVTLYQYYQSKEEIVEAGYNKIICEISDLIKTSFPPTLSSNLKLRIILKNIADYFFNTGLNATWLVEDPKKAPVNMQFLRIIVAEHIRSWKNCTKEESENLAYRYLSIIQSEILYYRATSKPIPENIIEDIFDILDQ